MSVPRRWAPSWLVLPSRHRHLLGQPRGPGPGPGLAPRARAAPGAPGRPSANPYSSHRASQQRITRPRMETTRHRPPNICPSWKLTLLYEAKRPCESNHHHPSLTRARSPPRFHGIRKRNRVPTSLALSVFLSTTDLRRPTSARRSATPRDRRGRNEQQQQNHHHHQPQQQQCEQPSSNVSRGPRVPATANPSADE